MHCVGLVLHLPGGGVCLLINLSSLITFGTWVLLVALGVTWEAVPHTLVGEGRLRLRLLLFLVLSVWDLRRWLGRGALQLLLPFVHCETVL